MKKIFSFIAVVAVMAVCASCSKTAANENDTCNVNDSVECVVGRVAVDTPAVDTTNN